MKKHKRVYKSIWLEFFIKYDPVVPFSVQIQLDRMLKSKLDIGVFYE